MRLRQRRVKQHQLNNKKGFTLAELLTVVLITTILLGVGMVAVVSYAKNLKLTEMDNSAKQVFIAAQNHLTEAKASGRAEQYVNTHGAETDDISNMGLHITSYTPADYDQGLNNNQPLNFAEDYYYLVYNPNQPNTDSFLKYLLPVGAVDEELRTDGSYIIEYSPTSGDVYGVFFTTDFKEGADLGVSNVIALTNDTEALDGRRTASVRKNHPSGVVGYYGGALGDSLRKDKLKTPIVEVDNGNILKVNITDENYFDNNGALSQETNLEVTIHGLQSNKDVELKFPLKGTASAPEADNTNATSTIKTWSLEKDKNKLKYTIILDDITTAGSHFADLFPTLIPGENITVTAKVKAVGDGYGSSPEATKETNGLFASVSDKVDDNGEPFDSVELTAHNYTAFIANGRHLENIDTTISNLPTTATNSVRYISIIDDINWEDFFNKSGAEKSITPYSKYNKSNIPYFNAMIGGDEGTAGNYYPIARSEINSFNGHGCTISNIKTNNTNQIDSASKGNADAGLFRTITAREKNTTVYFKNIILKDFNIRGAKNSAAFAGETIDFISNTLIADNIIVDGGRAEGYIQNGNAAGFMGFIRGKNVKITNCSASAVANNTSTGDNAKAAGFIGKIMDTFTIENCYVGGHTVEGKYQCQSDKSTYNIAAKSSYSGGFIAYIDGTGEIKNCFSTASVTGVFAGGFVGYRINGNIKFNQCYAVGPVATNNGNQTKEGAFIGYIQSGTSTYNDCEYMDQVSDEDNYWKLNAIGNRTATGLISKSYSSFQADGLIPGPRTYNYDDTYGDATAIKNQTNKKYPFKTVGKQVLKDKQALNPNNEARPDTPVSEGSEVIYYGDWLKKPQEIKGNLVLGYREEMSDGTVRWSVLNELEEDGTETKYSNLDVSVDSTAYVRSFSYAFLSKDSVLNKEAFSTAERDLLGMGKNNTISGKSANISGQNYYYYLLTGASTNSSDVVGVKFLRSSNDSSYNAYFCPVYGNAMSYSKDKIKREIRSEQQLSNVVYDVDAVFYQTCNINLLKDYNNPVVNKNFTGTYSGDAGDGKRYSIRNLNFRIPYFSILSDRDTTGIFSNVSAAGTVANVVVSGNISVDSLNGKYVGVLAGKCNGTITNCSVVNSSITTSRYDKDAGIGLLVGICESGSKIEKCSSSGIIHADTTFTILEPAYIGGLVGKVTNTNISKSWSKANINTNRNNALIGGLVGSCATGTTITNSYAVPLYGNGYRVGNIFIGEAASVAVESCHGALRNTDGTLIADCSSAFFDSKGTPNLLKAVALTSKNDFGPSYTSFKCIDKDHVSDYYSESTYKGFNPVKDPTDPNAKEPAPIWMFSTDKYPTLIENPEE